MSEYTLAELKHMPYADYLKTAHWKQVAKACKERDGHRCKVCNSRNQLAAHHRDYTHRGEEHLFMDDLTTLCERCHERHHFPPKEPKPKVIVREVIKRVVEYRPISPPSHKVRWNHLSDEDRRFFRFAAAVLGRRVRRMARMGREKVQKLLDALPADSPQLKVEVREPTIPRINGYILVGDIASADADMPEGDPITLTQSLLDKMRTNGAFTTATVKAFGLDWKTMHKGWGFGLVGKQYSRAVIYEAIRGRHLYRTRPKTALRAAP